MIYDFNREKLTGQDFRCEHCLSWRTNEIPWLVFIDGASHVVCEPCEISYNGDFDNESSSATGARTDEHEPTGADVTGARYIVTTGATAPDPEPTDEHEHEHGADEHDDDRLDDFYDDSFDLVAVLVVFAVVVGFSLYLLWHVALAGQPRPAESSSDGRFARCGVVTEHGVTEHLAAYAARCNK